MDFSRLKKVLAALGIFGLLATSILGVTGCGGSGASSGGTHNVFTTGFFQGSVDFGGTVLTSNGSADMFLLNQTP